MYRGHAMHDICSHSEVITLKIPSNTRILMGFLKAKLLNELVRPSPSHPLSYGFNVLLYFGPKFINRAL